MRTHIAKALSTRSQAIRTAIKTYNAAATSLDEPRPTLDWAEVGHYTFLEDYTLLGCSKDDIRKEKWGDVRVREAIKLAL